MILITLEQWTLVLAYTYFLLARVLELELHILLLEEMGQVHIHLLEEMEVDHIHLLVLLMVVRILPLVV